MRSPDGSCLPITHVYCAASYALLSFPLPAGVIKDWMLIFFSFYLFGAPVTTLNLLGYAFCCTGVVVYNHMKLQARG